MADKCANVDAFNRDMKWYIAIALVTIIAGVLRLYKLGAWSLWEDEILTMLRARSAFQDVLVDLDVVLYLLTYEQLTQILIYFPLKLGGMTEWNARLMPALVGTFSLPVLYFPIKRLFSKQVALLTIVLLAVSPWHIQWSQSARFYVLLLLLFSLACFFFIKGIENNNSKYLLISVVLLYLATRERLFAMFFVPIVVIYFVTLKGLPWTKPSGLRYQNLAFVVGIGAVIAVFLGWRHIVNPASWFETFAIVETVGNGAPEVIVTEVSDSWIYLLERPFERLFQFIQFLTVPVFVMGIVGAVFAFSKKHNASLFATIACVVPITSIMILSTVQFAATRYAFISLVFWCILASWAIMEIARSVPGRQKFIVGIISTLLITSLINAAVFYFQENGSSRNWKDAFALVQDRKEVDDLVITNARAMGVFYMGVSYTDEQLIEMADVTTSFLDCNERTTWFIHNRRRIDPTVNQWIETHSELIEVLDVHTRSVGNLEMRVYRYDPDRSTVLEDRCAT